jgi:hypothetical protein
MDVARGSGDPPYQPHIGRRNCLPHENKQRDEGVARGSGDPPYEGPIGRRNRLPHESKMARRSVDEA